MSLNHQETLEMNSSIAFFLSNLPETLSNASELLKTTQGQIATNVLSGLFSTLGGLLDAREAQDITSFRGVVAEFGKKGGGGESPNMSHENAVGQVLDETKIELKQALLFSIKKFVNLVPSLHQTLNVAITLQDTIAIEQMMVQVRILTVTLGGLVDAYVRNDIQKAKEVVEAFEAVGQKPNISH